MKLKNKAVAALITCTAFSSMALTLGRMHGAALLDQPLDLSIQVQYDEEESTGSMCFDAEVFHADTKQAPQRVRVTVNDSPQSRTAQVRVVSTVPIDEPVVTVYLHAGCASKTTRRYVLLAEPAGAVVTSAVPPLVSAALLTADQIKPPEPDAIWAVMPPAPPRLPAQLAALPHPPASAATAKPVAATSPRPGTGQAGAGPSSSPAKPADAMKRKKALDDKRSAGKLAGQSRLRLDPLDMLTERVALLESSAKTASAADNLHDAQQLQKLQGDVQALLALATKNERSLLALRERLQKAEAERYDNPLVYGLAALLLACLGTVVYLWRRQGRVQAGTSDWWRSMRDDRD